MNAMLKPVLAAVLMLGLSACGDDKGDDDGGGFQFETSVISFTTATRSVSESGGTITIALSVTPAAPATLRLPFTASGTAGVGDGTLSASPLVIPAGATSAGISVTLADDSTVEGSETLVLTLQAPDSAGGSLGAIRTHTLTITDNDAAGGGPVLRFATDAASAAENAGTVNAVVNVTPAPTANLSIPYTVGGTSSAADRTVAASPLVIPAGSTSGNISVAISDDASVESSETVVLTLSAPAGTTLGSPSTHTLTLLDNDGSAGPVVGFAAADQSALESAGTVNINIVISPVSSSEITLPYTVGGTASPADRTVPASPLTIPADTSNASIPVTLVNDVGAEGSETVIVRLGTPTGAALGSVSEHTLTINDDEGAAVPQGMMWAVDDTYRLLRFRAIAPGTLLTDLDITGVDDGPMGFRLPPSGLDFRPATGELYLFVEDGKAYKVNTTTGAATKVGQLVTAGVASDALIGFDFNPCVDKIRVTGAGNQNFRFNPDATLLMRDTDLAFAAGDANAGTTPGVDGVGYTSCTLSGTTLFAIDSLNDILVRIGSVNGNPSNPNGGQLSTIGPLTVSLGGANQLPFDINTVINFGFTADNDGNDSTLYSVDLDTGKATVLGVIGDGSADIRVLGLAVQP